MGRQFNNLQVDPNLIWKRLDEVLLMVHLGSNRIVELNDIGATIWELLSVGMDEREIAERLTAEYDVQLEQAIAETEQLVAQLLTAGLLSESKAGQHDG